MNTTVRNLALLFVAALSLIGCEANNEEVEMAATASLENLAPVNGKSFSGNDTLHPVTFRWTPVSPKPSAPVTYKLRVWQLMQGQNGTQAMRENQLKITRTVTDITEVTVMGVYTGPCKPPYLCDFIWSVQAISANGSVAGEVIGEGNPSVFNF